METILVATSDSKTSEHISRVMSVKYHVDTASTIDQCFQMFAEKRYDFTFIELDWMHESAEKNTIQTYQEFLQKFWRIFPSAQIIVLSTQDKLREVVKAVKAGASNYLISPVNAEELKYIVESVDESNRLQQELDYLRDRFWQDDSLEIVRTNSPTMKQVFEKVRFVAPTKTTVLLLGETGVGKGVISKLIHRHSDRQDQPLIQVHCGAIPDTLIESELFGHEKGAFTGAVKRKLGRFEIARGGTIFLDEIGTISPAMQIKMLQVLQDKVFQRVGGESILEADVRIIAASNHDLQKMSETGEFRIDLFYRLSIFPIYIPPLRERVEDIPLIANTMLKNLNSIHRKEISEIHPLVLEAMLEYAWPGNIREMENIMERAFILETSSVLTPESFPQELFNLSSPKTKVLLDTSRTLAEVRKTSIEQVERQYLKELLSKHNGKINKTAESAGISTRQLHKLMTKHRILKEEFKPMPSGK